MLLPRETYNGYWALGHTAVLQNQHRFKLQLELLGIRRPAMTATLQRTTATGTATVECLQWVRHLLATVPSPFLLKILHLYCHLCHLVRCCRYYHLSCIEEKWLTNIQSILQWAGRFPRGEKELHLHVRQRTTPMRQSIFITGMDRCHTFLGWNTSRTKIQGPGQIVL